MAGKYILQKEKEFLKAVFDALDNVRDGELEPEEFIQEFKSKFGLTLPKKDMERMVRHVDLSGDGNVQFTEFLAAACLKD